MTKNNSTVEAAVTASAKELKTQKGAKAKRIVIGIDAHLRSYHVARKIDNGAVGPVAYFGDQTKLLLWLEKQRQLAEEVVVVYEAGPLGYVLLPATDSGAGTLLCLCARC